jgi:hypothetical protein
MKFFFQRWSGLIQIQGAFYRGFKRNKAPQPDFKNILYGEDKLQTLDIWIGEPGRGVLVGFHSGGFVHGKKFLSSLLRRAHADGFTVVAAGYRLAGRRGFTVGDSLEDAGSVINYLKGTASEYGFDGESIAASGNSAGGLMALYLAMTSNRESGTGVCCATAHNAPTSLDPVAFRKMHKQKSLEKFWFLWSKLYGIRTLKELETDAVRELIAKFSPDLLAHASSAPIVLSYSKELQGGGNPRTLSMLDMLHSPLFGLSLQNRCASLGVPCWLSAPDTVSEVSRYDLIYASLSDDDLNKIAGSDQRSP